MRSFGIAILFVLAGFTPMLAQNRAIDSLSNLLKTEHDDTNKVKTLNALSFRLTKAGKYTPSLSSVAAALELAERLNYNEGKAHALHNYGIIYWYQGDYPKALDYYLQALAVNKKLGNKTGIAGNCGNIGMIYDIQGQYSKAIDYTSNSLSTYQEIGDKEGIATATSGIGVIYEELQNYPKALEYCQKAIVIDKEMNNKAGIARNLNNIGLIYSNMGEIELSLEYSFKALSLDREIGNKNTIAINLGNIGEGYVRQKKFTLAQAYLDSALNLSKEMRDIEVIREVYKSYSLLDSTTGNYKKALADNKKYIAYRDSLINQESEEKISQIEARNEFQKKEDSIRAEQEKANIIRAAEISRKNIITYSTIVIEILTGILAVLFINRQQIRRKRDQMLYEKEKQRMEGELANAKLMLDEYLKSMVEKNQLLEQFKTDVENLKNLKAKIIDENRIENIENLNKATILTEEDWDKFKKLFEEAYKGFFVRLKEKLPDLTQAEIRLVCLTKLKLETKQMAGVLGVSADTIKKTRYRLRKKLGLSEEDSLDDISLSI